MRELKELSTNYATEKTNELMSQMVAQAFVDGYRMGYKDRENEIPVDFRNCKTEFVDLELPSGTLWASEYEKKEDGFLYLPYMQAKRYGIPTKEQWDELVKYCEWGWYGKVLRCTGRNGEILDFPKTGRIVTSYCDSDGSYFWLSEDSLENEKGLVCLKNVNSKEIEKCFMGHKLPIRLVRKKIK